MQYVKENVRQEAFPRAVVLPSPSTHTTGAAACRDIPTFSPYPWATTQHSFDLEMSQIRNKFSWKLKQPRNQWYIFGFISFLICYECSCRSSGLLIPTVAHTLHWPKEIQTPPLVQGLQNCCIISPIWIWSSTSGSCLQKSGQLFAGVSQVLALTPGFWTPQVCGVWQGAAVPFKPLEIQESRWRGRSSLVLLVIPVPVCFCTEGRY